MPSIIHQDQTGFIKSRHSNNNVRRLLNLISRIQRHNSHGIVMTLDAEKAFDKVNWSFLFATLSKFGFGESFIHWIYVLYNAPKATVTTNGITSKNFTLQRGTRQGCPLSPLLFAIFIELLASAIRQNCKIQGIHSSRTEHKINLYADDILLYLQKPKKSLQELFSVITKFSQISDYSINWSKSTILPITENSWNPAAQNLQFSPPSGNIKYFGINISPKLSDLVSLNFTPLLDKITNNLKRWNSLPLSLIGRIAIVKMKILPQVNYLFSMIPFKPTSNWFHSLDSAIINFYSKNKKPKISLKTLQKSKAEGGLDAPDFYYYYIANQIQFLSKWLYPSTDYNCWLELEQEDSDNIKLSDLPFITNTLKRHDCFKNQIIASTLSAWWKALEITNTKLEPSLLSPIWHNPDFEINKKPLHLNNWEAKGITHLRHIFQNDTILTFSELLAKFEIKKCTFPAILTTNKNYQKENHRPST